MVLYVWFYTCWCISSLFITLVPTLFFVFFVYVLWTAELFLDICAIKGCRLWINVFSDTEDASEGETGKKDREFTGIKEQYVILIC